MSTSVGSPSRLEAAELRALFNAAVDAIIVIDGHGRIEAFNAGAESIFGYEAGEVTGRDVALLMPDPYRAEHPGYIERYLRTREARVIGAGREVEGRRRDGTVFPVHLSVGEATEGRRRRFVGVIRDLSVQKAAERNARALEARLADMGRFSLMGEMAAGLAHEINQPLAAIATYAQAAKRLIGAQGSDARGLEDVCDEIAAQARRAGQVIENLRKFIRKQEIDKQSLDVNSVVRNVMNLVEADAHAEGIGVAVDYGRDLPRIAGNAVQLQQVLLNLTRNAVDAMHEGLHGGGNILIETANESGGMVRIAVTDNGHGVPPALAASIFYPFVTTKREGLGVGLAVSKTIIEACGGTLSHAENPAGGAVFEIRLPREGDKAQ